jgi:hypothetical protein
MVDDLDDIDAGQQRLYEIVWNHLIRLAPRRGLAAGGSRQAGYFDYRRHQRDRQYETMVP